MHLVIPFASTPSPACEHALRRLRLPHLEQLLGRLGATALDAGDEYQLSPPHERVLGRLAGWAAADGCLPWAARRAQKDGIDTGDLAWGLLTPTHWHVGTDHMTTLDPQTLALTAEDSRALMDGVAALFVDEGWLIAWGAATRWYVAHESLSELPTASLDRVIGRNPDLWMPDRPGVRTLRRIQSEVQMVLHDHPVNDRREAAGLPAINTVWLSGCGVFQPSTGEPAAVIDDLRAPLLGEQWEAWMQAWQHIDDTVLKEALARVRRHEPVTLHLCGERHAQCYEPQAQSLWRRITGARPRVAVADALMAL